MLYDYLFDLISHFDGKDPQRCLSMIEKSREHEYISDEEYKNLYRMIKDKYYAYQRENKGMGK